MIRVTIEIDLSDEYVDSVSDAESAIYDMISDSLESNERVERYAVIKAEVV